MKKKISILSILMICLLANAQEQEIPERQFQRAFGKLDFLPITMPIISNIKEKDMVLSGIHYNLMLKDWAYVGLGIYGAIRGERGGFFTLGLNAGIKNYFYKNTYVDAGLHFGGGGGAAAPDGGGAFILPHVNLGHDFKSFSLNAGWSAINFFDGGLIKDHQFNVGLEIPLDYRFAKISASEKKFKLKDFKESNWSVNPKRTSLMLHVNTLKIKGNTQGQNTGKTIKLAGFELSSYLSDNWFTFVKVDGAFDGIKAGFMDVFLGGGYHISFNNNSTNLLAKLGLGAGGGGGIDSRGGFLMYPDLSIEQRLFNDMYLSVNKGFTLSPNKHFYTSSLGVGVKYYIERNGVKTNKKYREAKFKGLAIVTKQDFYFDAQRDRNAKENLHQISLQINLNLSNNVYVAGQTSFANFGNAGAYGEGLVGLGLQSNQMFNESVSFFLQALGGAAGGGGISTGEGLIIKPSFGFNYKLNDKLSLRTAAGLIKAKGGSLNSTTLNIGVTYQISFLKLKK